LGGRCPSGGGGGGERGFVGGTIDATTGLTHLGAREYEPAQGRFISVDPVLDPGDPQQLNGYAYANNAPTVQSDPTGLRSETIGDDYGHQTYVGGGHRQTSPANVVTVHRQRPDNSRNHLGRQRPAGDGGRNALPSGPREKFDQDVAAGRQSPAGGYGDCDSGCLAKIFAATIAVPAVAAAGTACVFSGACETGTLATAASPLCVRFCESAANLASGLLGGDPSPYSNAARGAKSVDELVPGVKQGWSSRLADNGKGTVWQAPTSTGNAKTVRVMEPTERYPNGYVRFFNEHGQPIGLNGKPGPRSDTHIPRNPDGTYDLPEGW
jgi:RHS repeat-associated protein